VIVRATVKIVELLTRESLPHKDFFHINEAASLLNVKPHELRYWEAEFPQIRSQKSKSGQRIYRREDVIVFFAVKALCVEKKLTVAGARKILAQADEKALAPINENKEDHSHEHLPKIHDETTVSLAHGGTFGKDREYRAEQILGDASQLLDQEDDDVELDEHTQQIYQSCGDDLMRKSAEVEAASYIGETNIIHCDVPEKELDSASKMELQRTVEALTQSKNSLTELLAMLEKYRESSWWSNAKF